MESNLPITRTKIIIPRRREDLIPRLRLRRILDEAIDNRLVIVAAPAGYGKTSLLVDFAHQSDQPVCWLSLDALDQDPQRMIAHFIAAIHQVFPEFGQSCKAALEGMPQDRINLDVLVSLIVNDAYDSISEHFVIILDDYHLVEDNADINYFINRFLLNIDENCHLVISSRRLLPLPDMPLLVARGQVGGLGFEELAFNDEEIKELYLQNHHVTLSDREVEDLAQLTEGWITGLILSTQISNGKVTKRNQPKNIAGVGLYEYLAHQVLANQPDELKEFLFQTSLLEEFDGNLCEQVIGQALGISKDWTALMQQLQRNNLFVLPVVEDKIWLRYHHLFRDFLQSRMVQLYPDDTEKIRLRLADHYSKNEEWLLAYQVYKSIGDTEKIARMVTQAGRSLIARGRLLTLQRWLDEIPEEYFDQSAQLLSLLGAVQVMLGDPKKGIFTLTKAVQSLLAEGDREVLAHTYVRRSGAYRMIGDYTHALEDADRAIEITAESSMEWLRAGAYYSKGTSLNKTGNLKTALEWLKKAQEDYQTTGDLESASKVSMEIAVVTRHLGQYANTEERYHEVLRYYQSTGNIVWQANLLNNLGVLHTIFGRYEEALIELESAIEYAKISGYIREEGYALVSLGDLFKDIKAYKEAGEAYNKATSILNQIHDLFLEFYINLSMAELELARGRFTRARELIESAQEIALETGSKYEMNLCKISKGKMALLHHNYHVVLSEVLPALTFFNEEGHHYEACKCRLLVGLAHTASGNRKFGHQELLEVTTNFRNSQMLSLLSNLKQPLENTLARIEENGLNQELAPSLLVEMGEYIKRFESRLPALRKQLRRRSQVVPLSAPELTILTFGKTQVKIGEHVITGMEWKSQNARDLLILLLMSPEGKTKEEIGAIFWPDLSPTELKLRFKNTIYRLRHAAGKDVVLFEDEFYLFNRGMDYEADFETFAREMSLAKESGVVADQISRLQAGIKLYKGSFLPDLSDEWVLAERERYRQLFVSGMLTLAQLLLEQGEFNNAIGIARQLLTEDPCNEYMTRIAMRAHAALGNLAAVIRQYEECVQALREEFGTRPSAQTVELFSALSRSRRGHK